MKIDSRDTGLIRRAANLEIQEQQRLAVNLICQEMANLPKLDKSAKAAAEHAETLIAAHRGQPIDSVLAEFRRLPAGCGRPRLPGKVREAGS